MKIIIKNYAELSIWMGRIGKTMLVHMWVAYEWCVVHGWCVVHEQWAIGGHEHTSKWSIGSGHACMSGQCKHACLGGVGRR